MAAAALLTGAAVTAAAVFDLPAMIQGLFGDQAGSLASATQLVQSGDSADGITLTVRTSTGDNNVLYLICDIARHDGAPFEGEWQLGDVDFHFKNGSPLNGGYTSWQIPNEKQDQNQLSFAIQADFDAAYLGAVAQLTVRSLQKMETVERQTVQADLPTLCEKSPPLIDHPFLSFPRQSEQALREYYLRSHSSASLDDKKLSDFIRQTMEEEARYPRLSLSPAGWNLPFSPDHPSVRIDNIGIVDQTLQILTLQPAELIPDYQVIDSRSGKRCALIVNSGYKRNDLIRKKVPGYENQTPDPEEATEQYWNTVWDIGDAKASDLAIVYGGKDEWKTELTGEWSAGFTVAHHPQTRSLAAGKPLEIGGRTVQITNVELSSLSASVATDAADSEALFQEELAVSVQMQDGQTLTASCRVVPEEKGYLLKFVYEKPVNPDQIKTILLNDTALF